MDDRLKALRQMDQSRHREDVVSAVAAWLKGAKRRTRRLCADQGAVERLHPLTDAPAEWPNLLCASLSARLVDLARAWQESLVLTAALGNPTRIDPEARACPATGGRAPFILIPASPILKLSWLR